MSTNHLAPAAPKYTPVAEYIIGCCHRAVLALAAAASSLAVLCAPASAWANGASKPPVAPTKVCAKGFERAVVLSISKVDAPGFFAVSYKGKNGSGTMLVSEAEVKSGSVAKGSTVCAEVADSGD